MSGSAMVGSSLEVQIDSVAYRGAGVARLDGQVVFVPGGLPGERLRVTITRLHRGYAEAALTECLQPSPDRIEPCCQVEGAPARTVPGCVYGHVAYPAELVLKQHQLGEFLYRLPGFDAACLQPPFAAPQVLHYRNKIVLHAQTGVPGDAAPPGLQRRGRSLRLGYVDDDGVTVVDLPACPLARAPINERLAALRDQTATLARLRDGQSLTLRWTQTDGVLWWLDQPAAPLPALTEVGPLGPLEVPGDGFYQVNPDVANELVRRLREAFAQAGAAKLSVLDLYCGGGIFGLACAQAGSPNVLGIEAHAPSVRAARRNARQLGLPARFECADATAWIRRGLQEHDAGTTAVVVDPPRAGLDPAVAAALAAWRPAHLFYISCDPATLTRDLRQLLSAGYAVRTAELLDMFPRTAHFETFIWLERHHA